MPYKQLSSSAVCRDTHAARWFEVFVPIVECFLHFHPPGPAPRPHENFIRIRVNAPEHATQSLTTTSKHKVQSHLLSHDQATPHTDMQKRRPPAPTFTTFALSRPISHLIYAPPLAFSSRRAVARVEPVVSLSTPAHQKRRQPRIRAARRRSFPRVLSRAAGHLMVVAWYAAPSPSSAQNRPFATTRAVRLRLPATRVIRRERWSQGAWCPPP